jgi:hypothetical protein
MPSIVSVAKFQPDVNEIDRLLVSDKTFGVIVKNAKRWLRSQCGRTVAPEEAYKICFYLLENQTILIKHFNQLRFWKYGFDDGYTEKDDEKISMLAARLRHATNMAFSMANEAQWNAKQLKQGGYVDDDFKTPILNLAERLRTLVAVADTWSKLESANGAVRNGTKSAAALSRLSRR